MMIAVSIGHRGNDPVIAMSLGAKDHIRNPGHHFTNAELAHRFLPQVLMICGTPPSYAASASVATATKRRNKGDYFKTVKVIEWRARLPVMGWPGRAQRLVCWTAAREALRKAQGACDALDCG